MPRPNQLSFLPHLLKLSAKELRENREHGGDIRKGKRKIARPFDPKKPMHLVFRSTRARGVRSMLHPKNKKRVDVLVKSVARKSGVRIYQYANVGNHLHLLVSAGVRKDLQSFLRRLSGAIALLITGARKGSSQRFWDGLVYSRIVTWGREFKTVTLYVIRNLMEAELGIKRDPGMRMFSMG